MTAEYYRKLQDEIMNIIARCETETGDVIGTISPRREWNNHAPGLLYGVEISMAFSRRPQDEVKTGK